jgi:hypothetical protein
MTDPAKPARTCGTCTLCCKAVGVHALAKPAGAWCPHCERRGGGCRIYNERPGECRTFSCAWLDGLLPEESDRPDRLKVVLFEDSSERSNERIIVFVEAHPGAVNGSARAQFLQRHFLSQGCVVVIRNADYVERHQSGYPPLRDRIAADDPMRIRPESRSPEAHRKYVELLVQRSAKPPGAG